MFAKAVCTAKLNDDKPHLITTYTVLKLFIRGGKRVKWERGKGRWGVGAKSDGAWVVWGRGTCVGGEKDAEGATYTLLLVGYLQFSGQLWNKILVVLKYEDKMQFVSVCSDVC